MFVVIALVAADCAKKKLPPATVAPPPVELPPTAGNAPPPTRVDDALPVPAQPLGEDAIANRSLDDLNRDSPLRPLYFALDSSDVDADGQQVLQANAAVMKKYPTWQVTIEGHCDERGTAEYNLALGERRALAVRQYLVSLGIAAERLRTVSYGKEFPFDPGHGESAWSRNRRANFVVTAK